jgi:hypothetical protein
LAVEAIDLTSSVVSFGDDVLDRMVLAVEKVRERLQRSTAALEAAGISYAVIGGNAVAVWVSKVDPGAARNTVDVDVMINRTDLDRVKSALETAGFVHYELMGVHMFLDGPQGRPRDAVHLLFANEKVRPEYVEPAPGLSDTQPHESYHVIGFTPLVQMKLTSFRRKDQVHLLDMIEVGLLNEAWLERLRPEFAARLKELLDDPDG